MEREHATDTADLQIIGAGLAGLIAANKAADAGLSVRLIERRTNPGGRADSADHHGYTLNVGPHALYLQGELRRVLIDLGLEPAGSAPDLVGATGSIQSADGGRGRTGLLPIGPASLLRTELLSPGAKWELARLLTRLPRLDPRALATTTVDAWLDDLTDRSDLRALLAGLINLTTYNPTADRASADAALLQLQMALDDGVHYIDGGWRSIVTSLSDRADRCGVERVMATATAVTPAPSTNSTSSASSTNSVDGETVVTTTDGAQLAARACLIASGGPSVVDRLLDLDGARSLASMAGPAVEASVLDLGLAERPPVGAHLGLDRELYATVHSTAAGLTPPARHLVGVARYRRPEDDDDPAFGPDQTRVILENHARAMGADPDRAEMHRYLHRLTVTGGMPLADRGGLAGRPPVTVEGRSRVFVAGDWVGANGLLADASAASAIEAVEAARAAIERPSSTRLVGA